MSILPQEKSDDSPVVQEKNVIDSYEVADAVFTTKYLYCAAKMRKYREECGYCSPSDLIAQRKTFGELFENESDVVKKRWEAHRREHMKLQPLIKGRLINALQKNNSISYGGLAGSISEWCSAATIRRWVISREGYNLFTERVIPLLSKEQQTKQLKFSKKYLNNWGLGGGKFLLIHYDEKWFWGLLLRKTAKTFEEYEKVLSNNGLSANEIRAYHKNHISKTMGIAMVGYAFEDCIENGGDGLKLIFTRAQSARVAQKAYNSSDGKIKRKKGDIFWRDCAVTGSNEGSSDDPKFSLLLWFREIVFPAVEKLVGVSGKYEGFIPIFQGDNAGPHRDRPFLNFVESFCERKGWYWEPQGPQMPHINVLDLCIFPKMSRNHCELVRKRGGMRVMKEDEIWDGAEYIWRHMPSCDVARAFVLSYRIAKKIVSAKGDNNFLTGKKGGLHSNVRKDFIDTATGIERRDDKIFEAPRATRQLRSLLLQRDDEKEHVTGDTANGEVTL